MRMAAAVASGVVFFVGLGVEPPTLLAAAIPSPPLVFFTDLQSGPVTGGNSRQPGACL